MVLTEDKNSKSSPPEAREAYRLVGPEEFCNLMISLRRLERCDNPGVGLRMLRDLSTGECYAIENFRLAKYLMSRI